MNGDHGVCDKRGRCNFEWLYWHKLKGEWWCEHCITLTGGSGG